MAFCIECGAKAPDVAKFCPQCGVGLVAVEEAAPEPVLDIAEPDTAEADASESPVGVETESPEGDAAEAAPEEREPNSETSAADPIEIDTAPTPASSLASAANGVEDAPKSKTGLFAGIAVVALLAAIGGAYAMGLFGGSDETTEVLASAPDVTIAATSPDIETVDSEAPGTDPVLTAYQDAIKTGRISDLGQFAKDNPDSGLAKDAETAAFASLQRQGSVLAYTTFIEYFPEADMSAYAGLRTNSDESALSGDPVGIEFNEVSTIAPSLRTSITQRAGELEPFIAQGNVDYAVSVIDEMLNLTDLNEQEATYLLNQRARAETSRGLAVPVPTETLVEVQTCWDGSVIEISLACPAIPEAPAPTVEVTAPASASAAGLAPDRPYDTAAKPIERFGAITPDAATEPGECDMAFSIDTSGSPTNIIASCTDSLFIEPAKETVSEWTYSPALLNGAPVQQDAVVVKIKFHLE